MISLIINYIQFYSKLFSFGNIYNGNDIALIMK